jgi:formylglycine-generating enzyme required for sulfatase activity
VLRGGCWYNEARYCRAAYRSPCDTAYVSHEVGFRVVLARE